MRQIDYIPVRTDPARIPAPAVRQEEGTPCMDFLMSLNGYMRMAAAGAAVLLTMAVALGA